jgi:hypothetical protein
MRLMRFAFVAAAFLSLHIASAAARPLQPAEQFFTLPYDGKMPACDDWISLHEIAGRFHESEAFNFDSPLQITSFDEIREVGFRTPGVDLIPRRYCVAKAMFNDQRERTVKYFIVERGGFVGIGRGIEWCVVGLDHYHAYSPACDLAGP